MLEKFTKRAKRVVILSQEEARLLDRPIGPEHVLLGIVAEHDGVGGRVLGKLGVTLESARGIVESLGGRMERAPKSPETKFSEEGKKALALGFAEARRLKHRYIGTEHLLLGLFLLKNGPIVDVIRRLQLSRERVLEEITRALASGSDPNAWLEWAPLDLVAPQLPGGARNNVVMCRVSDRDLEAIDVLVEGGVRATRSEAAAWLIRAGIESNGALFDKLRATVAEIRHLREQVREITGRVAREDTGPAETPTAEHLRRPKAKAPRLKHVPEA
jgi:hypothetical protein